MDAHTIHTHTHTLRLHNKPYFKTCTHTHTQTAKQIALFTFLR